MEKLNLSKGDKQLGSSDPAINQKPKSTKIHWWTKFLKGGPSSTIGMLIILNLVVWYLIPIQLLVFYGVDLKLDISLFNKVSAIIFIFFNTILILLYLFLYWITKKFTPLKLLKFQSIVSKVIIFVFSWVTLAGYIFPFIKTTGGMVDEINIPTNWINVTIVIITSGLITYLYKNINVRKIITIIFLTFYLVTIPAGVMNMVHLYSIGNNNSENLQIASQLSSETNLLVISFDGISGCVVEDIFTNEPEIQSEFKEFFHYSNVISTSPGTRASMITELFGNIDMRNFSDNEKGVINELPLDTLLMNLDEGKRVSISTYGEYNLFNTNRETKLDNIAPRSIISKNDENLTLYGSEMSRLFTGRLYGYFYPRITSKVITPIFKLIAIEDPFLYHVGQSWDKKYLYNDRDYHTLIDNMHISEGTDTLVIKYFHFAHTHFPVDFDKNGQYKSDDEDWYSSNQNYLGLYNQTYYALNQFIDLIKKLKELKIYDKTLLVFKSDHGNPVIYFTRYPNNLKINEHDLWGYTRYRPFLMIKDISIQSSSMVDIKNLVSLGDLAPTISTRFKQKPINNYIYPGLNLLKNIDPSTSPYIYLNIVKDTKSNHHYISHDIIEIDRRMSNSFIELLNKQESVKLSNDSIH